MIFEGKALQVDRLPGGNARVDFNLRDSSVNKFNRQTLKELRTAVDEVAKAGVSGLVFTSSKPAFIVGADITEFPAMFSEAGERLLAWLKESNEIFNAIEDLPFPTVSAIDGFALGGGFELAVATDFRIGTERAVVGFPEVKLGIFPGFGGTVRLPRLIGADNANQWIASGDQIRADQAFREGALDAVVPREHLVSGAEKIIRQANAGKLDFRAVRRRKTQALELSPVELQVAFDTAKAMVAAKAGPHYPAPLTAVQLMHDCACLDRAGALRKEHEAFLELAGGTVSANLVQIFLNEQFLSGKAKKIMPAAAEVKSAAVLGAGIMGGGIAYQSALKGVPIVMKDIVQEGLDLGMAEARKQLDKRLARGRIDARQMVDILSRIEPTLDYGQFGHPDIVVEAVVENAGIKKKVLGELERKVHDNTIIASNTSTISIDELASAVQRPENFCGMHFFNPVPVMPLVEVIRGAASSDRTVATTVAYAKALGKTPIVVNNCPGFLVNRILFPYFGAFSALIRDGAEFSQIDRVMEKFGWPMGPAYLLDVVGIDTAVHCQHVLADGFARMALTYESALDILYDKGDFGQKTGAGFYRYETDKRGKPVKLPREDSARLIAPAQSGNKNLDDQEIRDRMMVAMCLEAARCLEDGIVASPAEVDMGLILGIGFPAFRGGALRYIDNMGLERFCALADRFKDLGSLYYPTEKMRAMAAGGETFYKQAGGSGS
ncbi:MAG: fatty acid oxidation complex subunit alpha FadB [Gammaproteobacteria bacterium]|nr:fatty acid oxidation complex subunit alpha FadB [Gammaproteobacteria bacterium]